MILKFNTQIKICHWSIMKRAIVISQYSAKREMRSRDNVYFIKLHRQLHPAKGVK